MGKIFKTTKPRVGIFGKRNTGKSTVFNRLARYNAAVVSPQAGTTTDPVKKSVEHHDLGPLILIDTAGLDDRGDLGVLRMERTKRELENVDFPLLISVSGQWDEFEDLFMEEIKRRRLPYLIIINKTDICPLVDKEVANLREKYNAVIPYCARIGDSTDEIWKTLGKLIPSYWKRSETLLEGLCNDKDVVMLVVSSYEREAEGRLRTPHNRLIRAVLDKNAQCVVADPERIDVVRKKLKKKISLIISDFPTLNEAMKKSNNTPITTTGILFNRYKGEMETYIENAYNFNNLGPGAGVLMVDFTKGAVGVEAMQAIPGVIEKKLIIDVVGGKDSLEKAGQYDFIVFAGEENVTGRRRIEKLRGLKALEAPYTGIDVVSVVNRPDYNRVLL